MTDGLTHRVSAELWPDPSRVVAHLFLPGEEPHLAESRVSLIAKRVLALAEDEVERLADELIATYSKRHQDYPGILRKHAGLVAAHVGRTVQLSPARTLVLGASVTAEYATEAAALCNPSAVVHPDQSDLLPGQLRVAVSLRAIGEGHISSISFGSAVVGPGAEWTFDQREFPAVAGEASPATWTRDRLEAVLTDQGSLDELTTSVLFALPTRFDASTVELTLAGSPADLTARPGAPVSVDLIRRTVASAYDVDFAADTALTQRVLRPAAPEESGGMEDARFTRFITDDGTVEYRATYTAYDGHRIAPRLLLSPDLRRFQAHRLSGPAARNKGMALFPRLIDGQHVALCRTDGENTSLARSPDGYRWSEPQPLHAPTQTWELLQVGNCGPPIETEAGWLVLTHGVGLMRSYAIGALLLDRERPERVIGQLDVPLLRPAAAELDGYVPNVVYSCGGVVHEGRLWIPFGIDDSRIGVVWTSVNDLLAKLLRTGSGGR